MQLKWSIFAIFIFDHPHSADKNTPAAAIYLRANKFSDIFLNYGVIAIVGMFLSSSLTFPIAGVISYRIQNEHVDTAKLYLPLHIR